MAKPASTRAILKAIRDRLRVLYWEPQTQTVTVASVAAGQVYVLKIGNNAVSYTAILTDTTTTVAAALVALMQNTTARHFFAMEEISSVGAVITLKGGPAPFTLEKTGTTPASALTLGTPVDASVQMFKRVMVAPAFAIGEVLQHLTVYPFAVVTDNGGSSPSVDETPEINDSSVGVFLVDRRPTDVVHEKDMLHGRGLLEAGDRVLFDLAVAFDIAEGTIRYQTQGAQATLKKPDDPTGFAAKAYIFTVQHPILSR